MTHPISSTGLQTNTRRLELYIRVSLYVIVACLPLGLLGLAAQTESLVLVLATPALAVGSIFACRWALTPQPERRLGAGRLIGLISLGALGLTLIGWLVVAAPETPGWPGALFVALGCPLSAVVLLVRPLAVGGCCVATGVVFQLVGQLRVGWDPVPTLQLAIGLTVLMTFLLYTFWLSGWMLRVVRELENARRQAAELAIAEERLRIARDLHDLFGRTLAAVAVKSELAAELLRRGQVDPAADEMEAVRGLADSSGREVRQVVHGYREADLEVELAGARSLLDSAGISCAVRGAVPTDLDAPTRAAFGWVLREAVTNVIRHSRARECLIALTTNAPGGRLRLTVTNDGVERSQTSGERGSDGKGLLGMAERLEAIGGELVHDRVGERFTVTAIA